MSAEDRMFETMAAQGILSKARLDVSHDLVSAVHAPGGATSYGEDAEIVSDAFVAWHTLWSAWRKFNREVFGLDRPGALPYEDS